MVSSLTMIHLASMAVICRHLDIWDPTVGGKPLNIMTHMDILTVEYIKDSLQQIAGSQKMPITGLQIIIQHHPVTHSMTGGHLMENSQGLFHQILDTCTLILLTDSHKEQDLQLLMSPGQSYRERSRPKETSQDFMTRMGSKHITMMEDRAVTGVIMIRDQMGLILVEWREAL